MHDELPDSDRRATSRFEVLADDEVQFTGEVHPVLPERRAPVVDLTAPDAGWTEATQRRALRRRQSQQRQTRANAAPGGFTTAPTKTTNCMQDLGKYDEGHVAATVSWAPAWKARVHEAKPIEGTAPTRHEHYSEFGQVHDRYDFLTNGTAATAMTLARLQVAGGPPCARHPQR